jgi:hypothetical protein
MKAELLILLVMIATVTISAITLAKIEKEKNNPTKKLGDKNTPWLLALLNTQEKIMAPASEPFLTSILNDNIMFTAVVAGQSFKTILYKTSLSSGKLTFGTVNGYWAKMNDDSFILMYPDGSLLFYLYSTSVSSIRRRR